MKMCVFCKTRYKMGSGITFHKFPSDYSKKILWMKNMNFKNWEPKSKDLLCSKHFTEDCLIRHAARTTLRSDSVPTIFKENTRTGCISETTTVGVKQELTTYNDNTEENTLSAGVDPLATTTPRMSETTFEVKLELTTYNVNTEEPSISGIEHDHAYKNTQLRTNAEIYETVKHDHRYESSPKSSKKALQKVTKALKLSRIRVQVLSQRVKRLKTMISSLKIANKELKKLTLLR